MNTGGAAETKRFLVRASTSKQRKTVGKVRLLDLVENFTLFSEHKAGLVKIIGQNHQFLGVNNAIASMRSGCDDE